MCAKIQEDRKPTLKIAQIMYEKLANRHFERSTEIRDHCKTQGALKSITGR